MDLKNAFPFEEHLSENEKQLLYDNTHERHFAKGESVRKTGDNCLGMVYIQKGQLRSYMLSEEGKEITLFRLYAGDTCIMAASCVLDELTFDVFVDAEEDTDTLILNAATFRKLSEENIHAEAYGYKLSTMRFSDVMWTMEQILFMSFDRRLAIFLLDESAKEKSNTIILTHEQIAKYMGSARAVVSRMLKYFENEGIVELSRKGVTITDKKKLQGLI